jgi:hypothetical protein
MAVQQVDKPLRYLHVKVVDELKDGHPVVNVKVPTSLVKFGLRMAQTFSPEMKNANIDFDELSKAIDEGVIGEVAHIEDEGQHKTIDVWVE